MANDSMDHFYKYLDGKLPKAKEEEIDENELLSEMPEDEFGFGEDFDSMMDDLGEDLSFHDNPMENNRNQELFVRAIRKARNY